MGQKRNSRGKIGDTYGKAYFMKTIYRPLEEIGKIAPAKPKVAGGHFDKMLQEHLEVVRGSNSSQKTQDLTPSNRSWVVEDALQSLKIQDEEYYAKGVKKQTLAQAFSGKNDDTLEARVKKFQHLIETKAKKYDLDPQLLAGLVRQESNFNPYAISHCGAMGLGQLMPETARYLGVKDPFNAAQNLDGAAKYLKEQLNTFNGNVDKALAAYNAGPGAVKKYGGIPPFEETQNYVRAIKSHVRQIAQHEFFKKKAV